MSIELPRLPHKLRNDIRDLRRSSTRDSRAQYVAEGPHLAADIVRSSITPAIVVLRDDAANDIRELAERLQGAGAETYACGEKDMDLMTERNNRPSQQGKLTAPPTLVIGTGDQIYVDAGYDTGGDDSPISAWTVPRCASGGTPSNRSVAGGRAGRPEVPGNTPDRKPCHHVGAAEIGVFCTDGRPGVTARAVCIWCSTP